MNEDFKMNDTTITPDDPRLTAFALGELEGAEALAIAAAVAKDPELQAAVAELRTLAVDLEGALAAEPLPVVTPVQASELKDEVYPFTPKKVLRFPVFWVSSLMAAGFAILVVVQNRQLPIAPQEEVIRYDLDLTQMPPPAEDEAAVSVPEPTVSMESSAVGLVAEAGEESPSAQPFTTPEVPADTIRLPTMWVEISREEAMKASVDATMQRMGLEPAPAVGEPNDQSAAFTPEDLQFAVKPVADSRAGALSAHLSEAALGGSRLAYLDQSLGTSTLMNELGATGSYIVPVAPPALRASVAAPLVDEPDREGYAVINEQAWQRPAAAPLSTFAVDVDTASYSNVRRFLEQGRLPPLDAVRIEEMVNAFTYDYAPPAAGDDAPVAAHLEVADAPWAAGHKLVRIGLKAREIANASRAPANLVFLIDVSGSMGQPNKLPLAVEALRMLLGQLRSDDRVAIVTYAGTSGLALPSTPAAQRREILQALDALTAGGSTNGSNGLELAYDVAKAHFVEGGINRVILCTDGDFNVGVTGEGELERLIAAKVRTGVYLTALGFGMGNLQDKTLEALADRGNGHYGYVDSEREARRLLVEQVEGTLATVAQDVKVQVEFNPRRVAAYRLIGYENRALASEGFANDAVDGGELGAGHAVTALFEIVPTGGELPAGLAAVDLPALRYQSVAAAAPATELDHELLVVHVRAKAPEAAESRQWSFPLLDRVAAFAAASEDFRFASAVAGLGLVLRDSPQRGTLTLGDVRRWAERALGFDPAGRRVEFLTLVDRAQALMGR